jgi:hypothetical protein
MTCRDTLQCVHEPFGDPWYYGPERLSDRFEDDEKTRVKSGFSESTYAMILDEIERQNDEVRLRFSFQSFQFMCHDLMYFLTC